MAAHPRSVVLRAASGEHTDAQAALDEAVAVNSAFGAVAIQGVVWCLGWLQVTVAPLEQGQQRREQRFTHLRRHILVARPLPGLAVGPLRESASFDEFVWPAATGTAPAAGVSPRFIEGDVARLEDHGVGDGYTLLQDFGCLTRCPTNYSLPTSTVSRTWRRRGRRRCSGSDDHSRLPA